jgi:hypothetical protein
LYSPLKRLKPLEDREKASAYVSMYLLVDRQAKAPLSTTAHVIGSCIFLPRHFTSLRNSEVQTRPNRPHLHINRSISSPCRSPRKTEFSGSTRKPTKLALAPRSRQTGCQSRHPSQPQLCAIAVSQPVLANAGNVVPELPS